MEDVSVEESGIADNASASTDPGPRKVRVALSRIYKCDGCRVEGRPGRLRVRVGGIDVVAIFGGEWTVPVGTLTLGRGVRKDAAASAPEDEATDPVAPQPPAHFFGAATYLEIVASCPVVVDDEAFDAFQQHREEGRSAALKAAAAKHRELAGATDFLAGLIGLRLGAQWVSGDTVERRIAFRADGSVSFTSPFSFNIVGNPTLDDRAFDTLTSQLPKVRTTLARAGTILSWLLRAWGESDDPVNEFTSLFVPLEMMLGAPEPPDAAWSERGEAVMQLVRDHGGDRAQELLGFLQKALQPPSILVRRFRKLARQAALPGWEADVAAVKKFAGIRQQLLHLGQKDEVQLKVTLDTADVRTLEDIVERYASHILFGDLAIYESEMRPRESAT